MRQVILGCAMLLVFAATASAQTGRDARILRPDGAILTVTYTPAAKPGPGVLLLHACNRNRKSWDTLTARLVAAGYHVLAYDYRGYGDSTGAAYVKPGDLQRAMATFFPGDAEAAYSYLRSQSGVDKNRIGAAGASCGVNQAVQLALIHPQMRSLVLLSGNTDTAGRQFLREAGSPPILAAASDDDDDAVQLSQWFLSFSHNPLNHFEEYKAAGHGTDMFKVEKGLEPMIVEWFDKTLRNAPAKPQARAGTSPPTPIEEFWSLLEDPGGAARATEYYEAAKKRDPKIVLFPESVLNAFGYGRLEAGEAAEAVIIFKLNMAAYPASPNVYDSLADGYVAVGDRDLAIQFARKTLEMLEATPILEPELRKLLRESAEEKLRKLGASYAIPKKP